MRVSEIFAMGGTYGPGRERGSGSYVVYPDNGRWTYPYSQGLGYYGGFGYGASHSRSLLGVLM